MMLKKFIPLLILCNILFFSCASSSDSNATEKNLPRTVESTNEQTMAEIMQKLSGVQVRGSGNDTTVRVMVGNYFNEPYTEPLFLLNGVSYADNFLSVQNGINPQDVKSVQVYKTPAELGRFGLRGANGVIDINLK